MPLKTTALGSKQHEIVIVCCLGREIMQVHSPDYDSSGRCCRSEGKTYSDCGSTLDSAVKNDEESMQFESETENGDAVLEEDKRSGDSLSSSISMTDSDLSSPEDCDSLDLSESESITDVTPLNSPYCDSPLPHARCSEQKYKDVSPSGQNIESRNEATFLAKQAAGSSQPNTEEMNLIISAIQKLEFERGQNVRSERHFVNKRKNCACGNDDGRRPDQENQHLFKRIISQQSRGKVYTLQPQYAHKTCSSSSRYRQHRHADSDSAILLKKYQPSNKTKDSCRTHSHRQQKCLSHPSSYAFAETEAIAKMSASGSSPKSLCNSASDASSPDASASSQGAMYDTKTLCGNEDMGTVDFSEEMSIH